MTLQLRQRIGSAVLLLPFVAALIWLGPWTYVGLLGVVAILGGWELSTLLRQLGWRAPRLLPLFAPAAFAATLAIGPRPIVNAVTALFWLASVVWLFSPRVPSGRKLGPWAWLLHVGGAVFLGLFLGCLGRLKGGPWPGAPDARIGSDRVFYTLLVVWACDTGAYVIGSLAGRHPLWPAVSPKKTWEGAIGGTAAAVVTAVLLARPLLGGPHPWRAALLGLCAAGAAQIGDLFESRLKRKAGVKDSGSLLPGHGGILDRLDSLLFAAPIFYYGLNLMLP